jgi:hypothetical protein
MGGARSPRKEILLVLFCHSTSGISFAPEKVQPKGSERNDKRGPDPKRAAEGEADSEKAEKEGWMERGGWRGHRSWAVRGNWVNLRLEDVICHEDCQNQKRQKRISFAMIQVAGK